MINTEKNLSLWQLTNEYQQLLSQLYNPETGEVDEIIQAKLNALEPDIEKKCIMVTHYIKKLESEVKALHDVEWEIAKRKAAYDYQIERQKKYLLGNMDKQGITKITCPFFSIRLTKNNYSTDILDIKEIPKKFMKEVIKTEIKPDKNLIKSEVLRTGEQVVGAYVSQKTRVDILIDKL